MFTNARVKLTVLLVAIVTILYALTATAVYAVMDRTMMAEIDARLRHDGERAVHRVLSHATSTPGMPLFATAALDRRLFAPFSAVVARGRTGGLLFVLHPSIARKLPWSAAEERPGRHFSLVKITGPVRYLRLMDTSVALRPGAERSYLQFAVNADSTIAVLRRLRDVMTMVGVFGVLGAFAAGFWASGRALRPIVRSWRQQRRFVADASHELRTPLAVIQSNLDIVLGHADQSVLDNLEWITSAKGEARRLVRLTDDLLTLARADSREGQIRLQTVDLADIVARVVERFSILALGKEQALVHAANADQPPEALFVSGDPDRLYQLTVILIDNAVKYTPVGGRIEVILLRSGRHSARLQVADSGPGMDRRELGKIFDRFYRGDAARSREGSGAGLGLAIAKWIVDMHKGKITVQSEPGRGTIFTVTLPLSAGTPPSAG